MPRYFFHLHNDIDVIDKEGVELTDAAAARSFALSNARDVAAENVRQGRLNLTHSIEVVGTGGNPVMTVSFSDAVTVRWIDDRAR